MLKSQSSEVLISPEELQRIQFFATQNQRHSYKPPNKPDDYTFKPQINKKSANIQRTVDDLLRWNERKSQKLQQYCDDHVMVSEIQAQEIHQNANRRTHDLDVNQPSVFERLYVVRKSNETVQQSTKRNTSDSHPYFTRNMSNTLFSEYKKSQMQATPTKVETLSKEEEIPEEQEEPQKPCLPNRLFFGQQETPEEEPKVTIPQHMFVDFREQIKQIISEPEPIPPKKPLQKKEIDSMVERMNNWLQKRNIRIQEQQEQILQNESGECTFQPRLTKAAPKSMQNSQRVSQQSSYSTLFRGKNN